MAYTFRQEMPPAGGYGPVNWAKKIAPLTNRHLTYAVLFGVVQYSVMGFWMMRKAVRVYRARRIEERGAYLAVAPLIQAEQDRRFLLQLLDNRDAEAELMSDVEGWKVGQLFDKPLYNYDYGMLPRYTMSEFYVHADPKEQYKRHGFARAHF